MDKFVNVEGEPGMVRDTESKAILTTNKNALDAYLKQRESRRSAEETINNLEQRLAQLEKLVLGSNNDSPNKKEG